MIRIELIYSDWRITHTTIILHCLYKIGTDRGGGRDSNGKRKGLRRKNGVSYEQEIGLINIKKV